MRGSASLCLSWSDDACLSFACAKSTPKPMAAALLLLTSNSNHARAQFPPSERLTACTVSTTATQLKQQVILWSYTLQSLLVRQMDPGRQCSAFHRRTHREVVSHQVPVSLTAKTKEDATEVYQSLSDWGHECGRYIHCVAHPHKELH